jgi:pyruvate dehydrogenase E2 component (dihydrolipoamide acetyltransferase)
MATPVEAPKLGNTVEECLLSRWVKQSGDTVAAGDTVAEIETDKATFEVTAPVAGTLLATFFEEGALVPVFTNLFVIGDAGEDVAAFRPGERSPAEAAPEAEPERVEAVVHAAPALRQTRAFSPRARRFAAARNFHPPDVTGSGPGGRVLESDLRRLYALQDDRPPKPERTVLPPVSRMRERIAKRMRESLGSTAQYTLHASADATGLLSLRARLKGAPGLPDININDLVCFCCVEALLEVPSLNAEFIDGGIREHASVHLGFACDTPRGLLVPVVRDAHLLAIDELAVRMKELAAQTIAGTVSPDDLSGATFTISNLGGLGIEAFTPILNPPQVAILGVAAIQLKPVRRHGQITFTDIIGLSLTCDHQVIDGAPGARFLQVLKNRIENVESLCAI